MLPLFSPSKIPDNLSSSIPHKAGLIIFKLIFSLISSLNTSFRVVDNFSCLFLFLPLISMLIPGILSSKFGLFTSIAILGCCTFIFPFTSGLLIFKSGIPPFNSPLISVSILGFLIFPFNE